VETRLRCSGFRVKFDGKLREGCWVHNGLLAH
jgi:hypothetical protein